MPVGVHAAPALLATFLCVAAAQQAEAVTVYFGDQGTTAPVTLTLTPGLDPVSFVIDMTDPVRSDTYRSPPATGAGCGSYCWGNYYSDSNWSMSAVEWGDESPPPEAPGFSFEPASFGSARFPQSSRSVPVTVTYDPTQNSCVSTSAPCYSVNVLSRQYTLFWDMYQVGPDEWYLHSNDYEYYLSEAVVPVRVDAAALPAPVPLPASLPLLLVGLGALGAAARQARRNA